MQLLVNYGKIKQAALWVAELVKLSSLETCVLLSLFTVTSASPSQVLHSLLLFLSHIWPSLSGHSALCCLPVSGQAQAAWALAGSGCCMCWLARTQCWLPNWASWGPSPGISPLPSYWFPSSLWELQFWDFQPNLTETNPKGCDKRHWQTGRQCDINLSSVGSQAKHKRPGLQTLRMCAIALGWDDLQPGISLPSKGQAAAQASVENQPTVVIRKLSCLFLTVEVPSDCSTFPHSRRGLAVFQSNIMVILILSCASSVVPAHDASKKYLGISAFSCTFSHVWST